MRTVFVTHNDLGRACIETLAEQGADLRAIYTRPPSGEVADQTTFRDLADRLRVPLHEVESVNSDDVVEELRSYEPELLFVVGWSRLVEQRVIDIASVASLGMHPAPLPRGRGRAPIAWSLIKGLDETALSLFHLVEEADAGDLVGQQPIPIDEGDDAGSLYEKVVDAGRALLRTHYPEFAAGNVPRTPQNDDLATWWPKRTPDHGLVDWTRSARELYDWIRGQTHPYPGAYSYLDGREIRIWGADPPSNDRVYAAPGTVLGADGDHLRVAAWEEELRLTTLQVDDDESIDAGELLDRYDVSEGDVFDSLYDGLSE